MGLYSFRIKVQRNQFIKIETSQKTKYFTVKKSYIWILCKSTINIIIRKALRNVHLIFFENMNNNLVCFINGVTDKRKNKICICKLIISSFENSLDGMMHKLLLMWLATVTLFRWKYTVTGFWTYLCKRTHKMSSKGNFICLHSKFMNYMLLYYIWHYNVELSQRNSICRKKYRHLSYLTAKETKYQRRYLL